MKMLTAILTMLAVSASLAMAAGQPSPERGKELFYSTALGTNGKSCASCHAGGKKLEEAAGYDQKQLELMVNRCIVNVLKGNALASGSPDLTSLVAYVKTLASTAAK
ncbi:MAG: cytochrome C [Oryzomonas sp.]|jgi:cytochrome c